MSGKSNDKLPILLSSVTLVIVVLTLVIVVAFRPQSQTAIIPTATTTISQVQHGNATHSNSNIVLAAGHVSSFGVFSNVFDTEFNATGGQSVSGSYSSTSPLDFYVMTPSQFQTYMGGVPYFSWENDRISSKGGVWYLSSGITYLNNLVLPSYGGTVSNYTVSGKFDSNYPAGFYILTPSQYANYEIYHQMGGYVYSSSAGQGSTSTINARIGPGSYYFVFYDPNAGYNSTTGTYQNTTATIQQSIVASPDYSMNTIYNATQSQNNTFSTVLPVTGQYFLVWEYNNASGVGAALQITKTIKVS
jgi:hypothetical protein